MECHSLVYKKFAGEKCHHWQWNERPVLEVIYLFCGRKWAIRQKVHMSCAFSTVASWKEYWQWKPIKWNCQREDKSATVWATVGTDGRQSMVRKSSKLCLKNIKMLPMKYNTNKKVWMTTSIVTEFSKALNAPMGVQGRNILLFMHNCASHTPFVWHVKIVYNPSNCTYWPKHHKMLWAVLQEAPTTVSCMLDGLRTAVLQQYISQEQPGNNKHITVKCFCLGGYRHEFNT